MKEKLKVIGLGALEAFGAGIVIGLASVWGEPNDVILSKAGFIAAATTAAKFGFVYFVAFLRKHTDLQTAPPSP
jgi:hypothetical protein